MNKLTFIFSICILLTAFGCKNQSSKGDASKKNDQFGAAIDTIGMISFDNMLTEMNGKDSLITKVFGKVTGVCQAKGCWMNITSDQPNQSQEMFVEFLDYGFFMPKDLAGKKVVMQGKAYIEETSVDELKHFAEDEGLTPEEIAKITEPRTELKFLASGVKILP
ncbi:MAG: DUF4920 domain-containing protein [Saprospiraceae bacterium]|jgi:hypothetical protein